MGPDKILLDFVRAELFPALIAHLFVEAGAGRLKSAARSVPQIASPRPFPASRALPAPSFSPVIVLSSLPGRVRLRVAGMDDDPVCAGAVMNALHDLPGVTSANVNPLTGSALLRYDPAHLTLPEIQAALMPPRMTSSRG
jgi:copper chaperone CopZ